MKKKKTLSFQLTLIFSFLVAATIMLGWIINTTLLERFYTYNKQKALGEAFESINMAAIAGTLSDDSYSIEFEHICATDNLSILVVDAQNGVLLASANNLELLQMQINEIRYGFNHDVSTVVKTYDNYIIEKQNDSRTSSEYLTLAGYLSDGSFVYIRTPLESVRETASLTNRFYAVITLVSLCVSIVIIAFISRRISRPIKELTQISQRMMDLDFEAAYVETKNGIREIDELGSHINNLSNSLEHVIGELKTANNELQKDIQKKEEIDEMRKEFLSNVSHELKTPLALISGYAEGLKEGMGEDPESQEFYCDVIMDESEKMNRMVKQLINLNQLEFGAATTEFVQFDLRELVKGVMSREQILADQNQIIMELEGSEPCEVWADEFQIEQVVTNYITNAIHHADGPKKIRLYFVPMGDAVRFCVFNTGKPIPEEDIDKIWTKFYKVDKARTRAYGGSGIGLSIVKAVMDAHHRACGVINHEDGVEFWAEFDCNTGK